ncbi:MAG: LamG-like jellyroll fold domain-containing protein [Verrucomicrobiota bacterium]
MVSDRWQHISVVKAASQLALYVNGEKRGAATVPTFIHSMARDFALGGNPHHAGNEFLAARFADLRLYTRALSAAETAMLASADK